MQCSLSFLFLLTIGFGALVFWSWDTIIQIHATRLLDTSILTSFCFWSSLFKESTNFNVGVSFLWSCMWAIKPRRYKASGWLVSARSFLLNIFSFMETTWYKLAWSDNNILLHWMRFFLLCFMSNIFFRVFETIYRICKFTFYSWWKVNN